MGSVYFKTIFYAPHEIPFITMNLMESYPYIDLFFIVEANRTHVGEEKPYIFQNFLEKIPAFLRKKIRYIKADLSSKCIDCSVSKDDAQMHKNEAFIWDCFEDYFPLANDDIVISTDADEVLYGSMYPEFFNALKNHPALFLPLHQFMYRMTYLWSDYTFWGPTIARAKAYLDQPRPHSWRFFGWFFPKMAGCHFSWQLTTEEMLYKLKTYAHHAIYGSFADPAILEKAVREKTYPFEPNRPFHIVEVDPDKDDWLYPPSLHAVQKDLTRVFS